MKRSLPRNQRRRPYIHIISVYIIHVNYYKHTQLRSESDTYNNNMMYIICACTTAATVTTTTTTTTSTKRVGKIFIETDEGDRVVYTYITLYLLLLYVHGWPPRITSSMNRHIQEMERKRPETHTHIRDYKCIIYIGNIYII